MKETTRRLFLQSLAAAGTLSAAAGSIRYAGNGIDTIEGIGVDGVIRSRTPSRAPVDVVLSQDHRFLYAVNGIAEYEGLPRGTVETFAMGKDGLRLLHVAPLSLSAILPRSAALSPDGQYLAVAVFGGGAYNILRIENGRADAVTGIVKLADGVRPAKVAFAPSGNILIGSDFVSGQTRSMRFENGNLTLLS
ncbi:beta-propeller fold lactonase family protein [Bryobacter aggregatus]|uniref:beta-propeller fold lactonase family protein n=1 Tax=Bryobacter aggregatus TaxID=360054 RepID=UPI0004E224A4|nr:beta-propeller fold lactonase family protein [Bryobacter aggregatus]